MRAARSISTALICLLLGAAPARAEDPAAARLHFEAGTVAFNLGDYLHAADEYKAAFKAKHDPVILYNIAQAYRLSGDLHKALFFYQSFLRNQPDTPNRAEVEGRIDTLQSQIAAQKAIETAAPQGTVPLGSVPPATPKPQPIAAPISTGTPERPTPIYKKWWLWTAVGIVVVGAAVGTGVGVALSNSGAPGSHFGTMPVF
jgi:tetratricopeptide (TPR) repeat protein